MHRNRVVRKFLGQPPTTPNDTIDPQHADYPQLRPSASQSTVYSAGSPLTCLDRSPDGQRAIIAGPNVLKILRVEGSSIVEESDLRSGLSPSTIVSDPTSATAEQFNIGSIRWGHSELSDRFVTASGNGRITIYDINRGGGPAEVARINDHSRQVHKLAINPHKASWLLSASHDGTIRSFDFREPKRFHAQSGVYSGKVFKGNTDAVRDVSWSMADGYEFASASDAGVIMQWDFRILKGPILTIRAHSKPCFAVAWHTDGQHLISGGMDQVCKVWNVKSAQKNQAPRHVFHTPAPIASVNWRPASWSGTSKSRRSAQVSVTYDSTTSSRTSVVHLWDLARPSIPYKEFDEWETAPTGSLWNTRDLLWSVDGQGYFKQTDVAFVSKTIDHRSLSTFAFSPTCETLLFLEERQVTARSRRPTSPVESHHGYQPELPVTSFSTSRSDSEDDAVTGFLGARRPRHHQRRRSDRSNHQINTLPANSTGMTELKPMTLIESVNITGVYIPKQIMAVGSAPGSVQRSVYQYYSDCYLQGLERYKRDLLQMEDPKLLPSWLLELMESFAQSAAAIGHYRLAQTWRILSLTMNKLLHKRAEFHRQRRLAPIDHSKSVPFARNEKTSPNRSDYGYDTPKRYQPLHGAETPAKSSRSHTPRGSPPHHPMKSVIFEERESGSNVTTPLVRPRPDSVANQTREAMHTSLTIDNDPLDLSQATSPAPIPVPSTTHGTRHTRPSVDGYDFYDMESIAEVVTYHPPQRKAPLQYDSMPQRVQPIRHDSSESFQMFSTSSDSQGRYTSSSESDGRNSFGQHNHHPSQEHVVDWESSFGSTQTQSSGGSGSQETSSYDGSRRNESVRTRGSSVNVRPSLPILRLQEASEPRVDTYAQHALSTAPGTETAVSTPRLPQDPEIIMSDYDPWPDDPSFVVPPLDPSTLVQNTINYEASKGALHASILILLLRSYLPHDAIDEYQAPAILRTYHQRLVSFKLFLEATSLRKLCVPDYPIIYASSQQNITVGFFCTDCHKPIENDPAVPESQWRCTRCKMYIDGCAVCKNQYLLNDIIYPEEDVSQTRSGLWWCCNGCGHGGHITCMQAWHASTDSTPATTGDKYSDGCCPIIGCLHPCLPGKWRDECEGEKAAKNNRALEAQTRENARNGLSRATGRAMAGVRKDAKEVNQSKAVEGVRMAMNVAQLNSAAGTSGGGGRSGSGVVRRKSVKMVAPGEDVPTGSRFNR